MPAVFGPAGVVTFRFIDETGSPGSLRCSFDSGALLADVRTEAAALYAVLIAASDAKPGGYSISYKEREVGAAVAAARSRVERVGSLHLRSQAGFPASVNIPSVIPAAVLGSGRVDEDNLAIAAVITQLTTGFWSDSRGSQLATLDSLYERYSRTTRLRLPTDRRPD